MMMQYALTMTEVSPVPVSPATAVMDARAVMTMNAQTAPTMTVTPTRNARTHRDPTLAPATKAQLVSIVYTF